MADIAPEIYAKIKESFDRKYAQAQLFGGPLSETLEKINNGTATFRDADLYAVQVGGMMADAMKEHLNLEELPGGRLYRNIAERTIGDGLKDTYGIMSNVSRTIQEEINAEHKIGLKAVQPKLETDRVDSIVERAVQAKTQESLNATIEAAVPNFARQVVDDTQKANARMHSRAGLNVKVEREYDGVGLHDGEDVCDWCLSRAGKFDYEKAMDVGAFERHEGCGCIITYTSAKGEVTASDSKYGGWKGKADVMKEREKRIIAAKKAPTNQWNINTYNNSKADSVRPKSIKKELRKSEVGTEVWDYLQRNNIEVQLLYGIDNPNDLFGSYDPFEDVIRIYGDKTKTILETSKTIIHEAKHRMNLNKGLSDFEYEFKSYEAEALHEFGILTNEMENNIIKLLKEKYHLTRD